VLHYKKASAQAEISSIELESKVIRPESLNRVYQGFLQEVMERYLNDRRELNGPISVISVSDALKVSFRVGKVLGSHFFAQSRTTSAGVTLDVALLQRNGFRDLHVIVSGVVEQANRDSAKDLQCRLEQVILGYQPALGDFAKQIAGVISKSTEYDGLVRLIQSMERPRGDGKADQAELVKKIFSALKVVQGIMIKKLHSTTPDKRVAEKLLARHGVSIGDIVALIIASLFVLLLVLVFLFLGIKVRLRFKNGKDGLVMNLKSLVLSRLYQILTI
jgi:hypothetical protein